MFDMQFAGRFAEAGYHQDRCDQRPGHIFTPLGQQLFQENVQADEAPQPQCQPGIAKVAQVFQTHAFEIH
jgi:hypothetical protein